MSQIPKHRHEMTIRLGGHSRTHLAKTLEQIAFDLETTDVTSRVSGGGYDFQIETDERMTQERYEAELAEWFDKRRAVDS